MSEEVLAYFTEWARKRPNSIEFWELFVTTERVIACFAGETFSSALLRADMGENTREELGDLGVEAIAAYNERTFEFPLTDLESLVLIRGTRFRRARLELEWDGEEMTFYNTKTGDAQEGLARSLANDSRFDPAIEITDSPGLFDRS
jgi:hypothetical protein